jgi:hypothetical protein
VSADAASPTLLASFAPLAVSADAPAFFGRRGISDDVLFEIQLLPFCALLIQFQLFLFLEPLLQFRLLCGIRRSTSHHVRAEPVSLVRLTTDSLVGYTLENLYGQIVDYRLSIMGIMDCHDCAF